jgi:hypothetical protein
MQTDRKEIAASVVSVVTALIGWVYLVVVVANSLTPPTIA